MRDTAAAELARVLRALASLSEAPVGGSSPPSAAASVSDVLQELIRQLEDDDTAAQDTLDEHRDLLGSGSLAEPCRALESALGEFDMETACEVAQRMLELVAAKA